MKNTNNHIINHGIFFVPACERLFAYAMVKEGYCKGVDGIMCFTTDPNYKDSYNGFMALYNAEEYWKAIDDGTLAMVKYTKEEIATVISDMLNGRKVYNVFLAD